jgi:hypothetical protein
MTLGSLQYVRILNLLGKPIPCAVDKGVQIDEPTKGSLESLRSLNFLIVVLAF